MAVVGVLEIQMAADLARLSKDIERGKQSINKFAGQVNNILGAIGVGISIDFFAGLIKGTVDAADKMNDLKKITGLTIKEIAGIEKVAALNGTSLDSVAKAVGIMSKNITAGNAALQSLGIQTKQTNGDFRTSNEILLDVADRFSRMQDGIQKASLAQEIFGKSGRELIPMLNEGRAALQQQIEAYGTASGFTQKLADDSDRFNDILVMLGANVTATKNNFVSGLLPALNDIGAAFTRATGSAQLFQQIGSGVGIALKGIVIAVATAVGTIKSLGIAINGIANQIVALANLDFRGAIVEGNKYFAAINNSAKGTAEFIKEVIKGDQAMAAGEGARSNMLGFQNTLPAVTVKATKATAKQNKEFDMQLYLLRQYDEEARRARQITQDVATDQEIYNQKLEELNRLKPYLTIETYNRALEKLNGNNKKVEVSTRKTTDEVSQLWIQAGRNIQSTLANSIFNFFDDGLKGMVKNVGIAVGRIASEFAALKLSQSIGLDTMFGMGGGTGGTGGKALSFASIASSARGGFGIPATIGRGLSMLPGSIGAFGSGMGGTGAAAARGAQALWGASGLTGANSMGAAFASVAGPLMAVAIGDVVFRMLAGNKSTGNKVVDAIPIIGSLGSLLFGHGPMKFRQQSLQGTASSTGFDGDFTNVFRAKGGLLVSNKHKPVSEEFSLEQQTFFDDTLRGFYGSAHTFAENLGLSTSLVDNFTKEVQIKSDKGKTVTEEAIAEMLKGIGNSLAENVLPMVATFRKAGEDSFATLSRLNSEYVALNQAAINLGASAEFAKQSINALGIETRTAYIDAAGGPEALLALTAKFSQNFLTEAERMAPTIKMVEGGLRALGIAADISKDAFGDLIQTLIQSSSDADKANALLLLQYQDVFLAVNQYKESLKVVEDSTAGVAEAFQAISLDQQAQTAMETLRKSVDLKRNQLTEQYNNAVDQSQNLMQLLQGRVQDLAHTAQELRVNTLSAEQALSQLRNGRFDSSNMNDAINTLRSQDSSSFGNVLEFKRSQAAGTAAMNKLATKAEQEELATKQMLNVLQMERNALDNGFNRQISQLDQLLADAQLQVDHLAGINTNVLSMSNALGELNRILVQGGGRSIGGGTVRGNVGISSQDIVDFAKSHSPMETYTKARQLGISSAQIAATGIYTQKEINDFVKQNNLASFDVGGVVPRTGVAMIHKDEQILTANDSASMSGRIDELTKAVEVLTIANNRMNRRFDKWDKDGMPPEREVA